MSSSPAAAVAASDPGGDGSRGKPKQESPVEAGADSGDGEGSLAGGSGPTGDSDVTMTEASEEVPAVAEVKLDGGVVAGDSAVTAPVVREDGDVAVASELMYATEFADMVSAKGCGDESFNEAPGLNGGDSGEMLEAEARALLGEAEMKPTPAGDIVVAGDAVVAPGSATMGHAEAEPNELEENYVDANPVVGNEGKYNGVAHCDKEMQNGVVNVDQCARYCLPPLHKDGFHVSDLVWGKVKSHPWWPGEIFDPSDASELALKHQKKGNRLVAYFGDNSFAWCDESQLKPFVTNYSQMEKQSSSDAFVSSINFALEELSRRILSGMSCSCLPEELSDNMMSYMVDNAGLKDGIICSEVNRYEILTCFSPESLLRYIKSLAVFPGQGGDLLELVIACSQLTSFYRSKGCPELASFQTGNAWVDNDMDTSTKNIMVEEPVISEVHPSNDKPKRGRGRPRKQRPEDDLELMEKKASSSMSNDNAYDVPVRKKYLRDFDDFDDLQNKKKRSFGSFEDSETKSSTPTFGGSFKIGECIRRAASQLAGSSSIVKSQNELMVYKNTAQAENAEFDISSDDAVNELTMEKCAKRRRTQRHHIADPKELLSQLCSVAIEPKNRYNSSTIIISYFTDYRNYVIATTTEANIVERNAAKRGRKRKVLPSPEPETTDHMQDSYWSGLSLHNHPINSLKGAVANTRPRRRRRSTQEADMSYVQHLQTLGPKKPLQVIERSIIHVDEKIVDEVKPTALVLSFGRSSTLPSETDLIKMFGRYGPLKESETEVQKNTNTIKIVFKKRVDAEKAFGVAGKYGMFGPSLRSYRLVNMPFSLGLSEANNPETRTADHGLEFPGPSESKVQLDIVQVDRVDITDKPELAKDSSSEQVEIIKQTCQPDASCESLASQVDMVEKTEQIDAELNGQFDQIGMAARIGPAEQVSTMEQTSTQDELSLQDQSEIVLSGAVTGVVQVVGVIEQARDKPLNEGIKDLTEADIENEVLEEARMPTELRAQCSTETMQTVEFQAAKEALAEIRCGVKLKIEALTEESVGQVATEKVKVPTDKSDAVLSVAAPAVTSEVQGSEVQSETVQFQIVCEKSVEQGSTKSDADTVQDLTKALIQEAGSNMPILEPETTAEVAAEQICYIEQTVQMIDVTDASGGQIDEVKQTAEDVAAELVVERAVESEVEAAVEKTVESKAATETPDGEATEVKTTAEAPGDIMENKPATEALFGTFGEGETTSGVPDERTEKGTAEVLAGEITKGETTTAQKAIEDSMVVAPEITTTAEKTVVVALLETLAGETTKGETTTEVSDVGTTTAQKATEDDLAAPDAITTMTEKTVVEALLEAHDEKAIASKKTVEDATVEAPNEGTTTYERTVDDTTVESLDEITTTASKNVVDAMVKAPDEIAATAQKTVEGATVEGPDEIITKTENIVDALVDTPDEKTTTLQKTVGDTTVEAPDEKTTTVRRTVDDATLESPHDIATTAEAVQDATLEARDEKAPTSENTLEDYMIEALDEKAPMSVNTLEDCMVEAQDEKYNSLRGHNG